jgi:ABC-2 type transport system permease protein
MSKYLQILKISFQQEFTYRLNFIMWRVRNVIQILVFFFLWSSVFSVQGSNYFGYDKEKIIAYAFLLIFVRAIVMSSRSVDVAGIISNGELSNLLIKPVNFFKYWITRDISSKSLNIIFSIFEIVILFLILKPNIFIQTNFFQIILFIISLLIAALIFFCIAMLTSFIPFWIPEVSWGAQFLVIVVFVEFLSGAFFPLDVFPEAVFKILRFTPFPHLIFVPIKTYLGVESLSTTLGSLSIGLVWSLILWILMKRVWQKGLKIYEAVGR